MKHKLFKYLLRIICKNFVKQSSIHRDNIIEYYTIMAQEARKEFTEDSLKVLDTYLIKLHEISLYVEEKKYYYEKRNTKQEEA